MFSRKKVKITSERRDIEDITMHDLSPKDADALRLVKEAQYRRQVHAFVDSLKTPFVLIAPKAGKDPSRIETEAVLAMAGDAYLQATLLLGGLFSAREALLKEMATTLPEDDMEQLLAMDDILLKEAFRG